MEHATDEFYYQSNIPPEPPLLTAQTLEINGEKYVLNEQFKSIKIVSHRYPPHVPMSADEQTVPAEVSPSMAANIPQIVHDQLCHQFLPAAKNLGQAGIRLLKTYHLFQEALSGYCDATHKLIMSADTAGHKANHEAKELSKFFKPFVEGVKAHQKVITEFDAFAHKVHDYSNKEKEMLKTEFSEYKSKENKLKKRKNGETDQDIAEFHKKEAANWARQQELRYKFFNDKLQSWIKGYIEIGKLFQSEVVPTASPKAEEVIVPPTVILEVEEVKENTEIKSSEQVQEARSDYSSSIATTLEDLPTLTNDTSAGVVLVSNNRRTSAQQIPLIPQRPSQSSPVPSEIIIEKPNIPPKPVDKIQPNVVSIQASEQKETYAHHSNSEEEQVPQQPVNNAPGGMRRAPNTIPGAVNVFGFANPSNPQPKVHYAPVQNASTYQVVTSDHIRVGRVVDNPVTEEQMNAKKFHVDVPSAYPSLQPQPNNRSENSKISVPSYFNPSQYGSILNVNDDFNASSGEQMTVNRGDKVILLKCGSRGWVFVRDSISNRTGWVPEPYVNP